MGLKSGDALYGGLRGSRECARAIRPCVLGQDPRPWHGPSRWVPRLPRLPGMHHCSWVERTGDRRALTSNRGSSRHLTPMLIQHLQLDPDVPDAEHIIEPKVRMIIEAMIEPAMELALHGMPVHALEYVMIHPILNAKRLWKMSLKFQVFASRRENIVVILLVGRIILPQPEAHLQLDFIVREPILGILDTGIELGEEGTGVLRHLTLNSHAAGIEPL